MQTAASQQRPAPRVRDPPNICRRKALHYMRWLANGLAMPVTQATPFECPTCGAEYKLVRVETKEVVPDQQITCRKCGNRLPGSEGRVILKYFLVDRGRRRASGALPR
jgi:hypothetical protein